MSVGGEVEDRIFEYVKRAMKISVRALNLEGKPIELEAEGYMAQCMQHEIDHLGPYIPGSFVGSKARTPGKKNC